MIIECIRIKCLKYPICMHERIINCEILGVNIKQLRETNDEWVVWNKTKQHFPKLISVTYNPEDYIDTSIYFKEDPVRIITKSEIDPGEIDL